MVEAPKLRQRSLRQLVLAATLLLALGLGSLAHAHGEDVVRPAGAGHCLACTLHTVVNPALPALLAQPAPLEPPDPPPAPVLHPPTDPLGTLRVAPKTSPPHAA